MKVLSVEQVAAIQTRVGKATEGPWCWEQYGDKVNAFSVGVACFEDGTPVRGKLPEDEHVVDTLLFKQEVGSHESCVVNYGDADFIAHARTDVPSLCDSHEALRAQVAALEGMFDNDNPEAVNTLAANIQRNLSDERIEALLRGLSERYGRMDALERERDDLQRTMPNVVPRSRYDVACEQYNELNAELQRVRKVAADEITRLEGERDDLRRQLEEGNAEGYGWKPRAVQAEAERDRLRAAIEYAISNSNQNDMCIWCGMMWDEDHGENYGEPCPVDRFQAALRGEKP